MLALLRVVPFLKFPIRPKIWMPDGHIPQSSASYSVYVSLDSTDDTPNRVHHNLDIDINLEASHIQYIVLRHCFCLRVVKIRRETVHGMVTILLKGSPIEVPVRTFNVWEKNIVFADHTALLACWYRFLKIFNCIIFQWIQIHRKVGL